MQCISNVKKTTIGIAIICVLALALAGCDGGNSSHKSEPEVVDASSLRSVTPLNSSWQFIQEDSLTEEEALSDSGDSWTTVDLPHTWNAEDAATTEQTTPDTPGYKRGQGWYRLEFSGIESEGTQWLQFDGASIVADVWLNGEKLGQHKGAFTAFRFDVTGKLNSESNVLLVRTDNSKAQSNDSLTAIAPLGGDFNMSGGLYRGVSLISTPDAAHFALNESVISQDNSGNEITAVVAGAGVYATTRTIENGMAVIDCVTRLNNDSDLAGTYTVSAFLMEPDGVTIKASEISQPIEIEANSSAEQAVELTVDQAHLWQGMSDPYLYKLVVELKDDLGDVVDKSVQDFGIRQMTFDPDNGFALNGIHTPLHGVNLHQDYLHKGWAISKADTDESLAIIKEMGANTIRLAHYPHSSYTYEQADKLGFVVMAEIPFVNQSALDSTDPETTGFAANIRLQLQELIRQQFNHASIGLWSIGNETTTTARGQTQQNNNVTPLLHSLNALAKNEDPSRVTTLASQVTRSGDEVLPDNISVAGITDTYSVNRYFQWYYGTSETQLGEHLDQLHADNPDQPIGLTEYGAGAAITHHTDNVLGGRVCARDSTGMARICYQPEEYAAYVHEKNFAAVVKRDFVYGSYVWNSFDFGSGIRHEGDVGATNTKGLVTFDRQTRKDGYYFYQANLSTEPVTYIASRRYTDRAYTITDVKLYSNADSVTLDVDGVSAGTLYASDCQMNVCIFKGVQLAEGSNVLTAVGSYVDGEDVTDTVTWDLSEDHANNVYIAAGQLTTGFESNSSLLGNHKYGSDNFFVGGELPVAAGWGAIGLSGNTVIYGLDSEEIPETGRVWDMWREGSNFSYKIPVANGSYRVTLGFLEPTRNTPVGARVFSVSANGSPVITDLDIVAEAGAAQTAMVRPFDATVSNGILTLNFVGTTGKAIVSNIAVVKQ